MEEVRDKLEYAVRFALQNSANNLHKAARVAEAKFASMVGRKLHAEEQREIKILVHDIDAKLREQQGIPSVVGLD